MRAIATALCLATAVAACDGGGTPSGLRGLLFGRSVSDPVPAARASEGVPVADTIVALQAAPTPGGVIVSAVARPPTQGHWDARLVPLPNGDPSVYLMEFRLLPPLGPAPAGTAPSREVLGGTFLTRQDLAGVRTIAVQGTRNRQSVRRQ